MAPGASALALLDPNLFGSGDEDPDNDDPRRKLVKLAALQKIGGIGGAGYVNPDANTEEDPDNDQTASPTTAAGPSPTSAADKLERASSIPPMPATFPADRAVSGAAARLQRAQDNVTPPNLKTGLVRALLTMAPALIGGGKGAAGAAEGADIAYSRNVGERNQAAQQYEFEAGRQERERDQAIKERLAQATIQSQAAYRALMQGIAQQRANTGQQRADTADTTAAANQHDKGMVVTKGPDGVMRVQNIPSDQLPLVRQAQLGVESATEELKKAQAAAVPEQIEIKKRALDIQTRMLQARLSGLELQKENVERNNAQFGINYGINPDGSPSDLPSKVPGAMQDEGGTAVPLKVATQMGPSGMEKSRAGAAKNSTDTLNETAKLIRDNKDILGPIWGRVSLAGLAVGKLPDIVMTPAQRQALEKIVVSAQSSYSFTSTAHGWRSAEAPAKFEQAVGGLARDPEMTATGMETLSHNMAGVVKRGSTARGTGATDAAARLRKAAPSSPAGPAANTPAPAPAATDTLKKKVRKWSEFVSK